MHQRHWQEVVLYTLELVSGWAGYMSGKGSGLAVDMSDKALGKVALE